MPWRRLFFCRIPDVSLHYPIILIKQSICGLGMETKKIILSLSLSLKNPFTAALLGRLAGGLCLRRYCADAAILSRSAPRQTRSSGRASGESSRRRAQINLLYCFPEKASTSGKRLSTPCMPRRRRRGDDGRAGPARSAENPCPR